VGTFITPEEIAPVPLDRKLDGPRAGIDGLNRKILLCGETIPGRPARGLVTIPSQPSQLLRDKSSWFNMFKNFGKSVVSVNRLNPSGKYMYHLTIQ
jgi:hypothetical protein